MQKAVLGKAALLFIMILQSKKKNMAAVRDSKKNSLICAINLRHLKQEDMVLRFMK